MKYSKWIGLLTYAVLFVFAILFYKERTIFMDASFMNFLIIKEGSLAIQVYRFGAFLTQLSILITSKLGLPLKIILLSYSVSFIILYACFYSIIKFVLKNDKLSLGLLLYNLLIVSGTFYWIQSEQIQGSAYLFLVLSFIFPNWIKDRWPETNKLIVYLLLFVVAFMHPLMLFQFVFMVLFLFLSDLKQSTFPKKQEIINSSVFFITVFLIKILFFKNYYDSGAMGKVKNLITFFPNYLSLPSFRNFYHYLITDYYLLAVLLILCSALYIRRKQWLKLGLLNSFFFGFLLLVNVSYEDGATKFYIESHYLTLSFFVIIAFVFDYLPTVAFKKSLVFISVIILIRLIHIYISHEPYTNRLNWERNFMAKTANQTNKKIVTGKQYVPMDTLLTNWGTPYEFWLLSTLEQKETRSIIILDDINSLDWTMGSTKTFFTTFGFDEYDKLDKRYFILRDTSKYIKVK